MSPNEFKSAQTPKETRGLDNAETCRRIRAAALVCGVDGSAAVRVFRRLARGNLAYFNKEAERYLGVRYPEVERRLKVAGLYA